MQLVAKKCTFQNISCKKARCFSNKLSKKARVLPIFDNIITHVSIAKQNHALKKIKSKKHSVFQQPAIKNYFIYSEYFRTVPFDYNIWS